MKTLYFASANQGKVKELQDLLSGAVQVKSLKDLGVAISWEETGSTFEENAVIKVEAIRKYTSESVLADDSGLCVPALGGAPGVFSARWAGTQSDDSANNKKLLEALDALPDSSRKAYFHCTLVYRNEKNQDFFFEGQLNGHIVREPRGERGFGYDPLFVPDNFDKTLAELSSEEKNRISHRGQAVLKFKAFLQGK